MMTTLERISKIWPMLASICSLLAIVMVSYMAQAVDDHDREEKPHLVAANVHDKDEDAHLKMQKKLLDEFAEGFAESVAQKVVEKISEQKND